MKVIHFDSKAKLLLLILTIAFLIRLIVAFEGFHSNVMANFSDDNAYWELSSQILLQGPDYLNINQLGLTGRTIDPGIGWILACIRYAMGNSWIYVFIVNVFVSLAITLLIFYLGKRIFDERTGLIAATWSIFYILFIKYIPTSGKDIWMTLLFSSTYFIIIKSLYSRLNNRSIIFLSVLFTFLFHLDCRYFFYFPFIAIAIFFINKNKKIGLKQSVLFTSLVVILMIPWLIRNYKVYDRIIISSVQTNSFTEKILNYQHIEYFPTHKNRWYIKENQIDSTIHGLKTKFDSGEPIPKHQIEAMKAGILPHHFTFGQTMWSSFKALWQPFDLIKFNYIQDGYRFDHVWSIRHNLSIFFTYGIILILSFIGMYKLHKENNHILILILMIFLLHTIIHIVFIPYTEYRYRITIDPLIIVLGSKGILHFITTIKSSRLKNRLNV